MTAVVISLALLAQAPAKPIDKDTFLREAAKGWAVLDKAFADVEATYRSEMRPRGITEEIGLARLGKKLRAKRGIQNFPGVVPEHPAQSRHYVTDGTAFFVVDRKEPDEPFELTEYRPMMTPEDGRSIGMPFAHLNQLCYGLESRTWTEQVARKDLVITKLETIQDGSRELIRMEYREPPHADEVISLVRGWCLFDPKAHYLPVESETERVQNQFRRTFKTHVKIEHKPSNAFPGLRIVPANVTIEALNQKGETLSVTILQFDTFAPCKLKPADFRPEAFGLETPK